MCLCAEHLFFTVYAAQGGTYDAVVVDMKRPPAFDTAKHLLACYVMMSRARSSGGFLVLRPATRKELSSRPPKYLVDELGRLAKLETSSHQELVEYIASLPMEVPEMIHALLQPDAPHEQTQHVASARASNTAFTSVAETPMHEEPATAPTTPQNQGKRATPEQTPGTPHSPRKTSPEKDHSAPRLT